LDNLLVIENLHACTEEKEILKGLSLKIPYGETHAIMGPNGAGKSTLAQILAGHPAYRITSGTITFKGQNLLGVEVEKRSHLGLFLSFQHPIEIPGVSNREFLFTALNQQRKGKGKDPLSKETFENLLSKKMEEMEIKPEFKTRNINEGFSGGERKKNEILQMSLFEPEMAILDETDSGLDIDAIRLVASGINKMKGKDRSILLITHYQRLLEYVKPDFVHVLLDGVITQSGNADLALELEETGYA